MVWPPTNRRYEFGDHCTAIDDGRTCNKDFACGNCQLAWKTYKKYLEEDDCRSFVIPFIDCTKHGIAAPRNETFTIAKVNSIEDLIKRFTLEGVPFKPIENMDSDEMRLTYPYWYALKTLDDLGEPLSYRGGKDIPLIVEYVDCVYMVAPVTDCE